MTTRPKQATNRLVWAGLIFLGMLGRSVGQADVPEPLQPYLKANEVYLAERIVVQLPEGIEPFKKLFLEAARKDPDWWAKFSAEAPPSSPLPYHEKLGLTAEQYQEYLDLWEERETKVVEKMPLRLELRDGDWRIFVGGSGGTPISLLRYDEESDTFQSTNGKLTRLEDIDVGADNLLGAWEGAEWRFSEKTPLGYTKENLAVGKFDEGDYGLLIYRLQDITSTGNVMIDQSVVMRLSQNREPETE